MATKTLTITEEAYNLLSARKESGDSFSDVIIKSFSGSSLLDIVGLFSDKEADALEMHVKDRRKAIRNRLDKVIL